MHHDYITSSELSFGDIVFNNCDPDQFQISYCDQDTIAILYRVIAYSLYAKRVVIPSRYLLSAGSAFDAVKTLTPLLEEGVIVPDLREGHLSFTDYVSNIENPNPEQLNHAKFLDEHASTIYSFGSYGQSDIYKASLIRDISEGGLLFKRLSAEGVSPLRLRLLKNELLSLEGSRSKFEKAARDNGIEHSELISKWAALRYYTTPAEICPRCIRDFPFSVSNELRSSGLSVPLLLENPDRYGGVPQPMALSYEAMVSLPQDISLDELAFLSNIVLKIRNKVPCGPAKFASIAEDGFKDQVHVINQMLAEAIATERKLSHKLQRFSLDCLRGEAPFLILSWGLGVSLGDSEGALAGVALSLLNRHIDSAILEKRAPFLETSEQFNRDVYTYQKRYF